MVQSPWLIPPARRSTDEDDFEDDEVASDDLPSDEEMGDDLPDEDDDL